MSKVHESPAMAEKAGMVAPPSASKVTVQIEAGKADQDAPSKATADLESGKVDPASGGEAPLYPNMTEDPRLRWMFIRKVYAIIAAQFVFTAGVASVISFVHPIPDFFRSGTLPAWGAIITFILLPLLAMWPMLRFRERHPINLVFLAIFTVSISLSIGVTSVTMGGRAILQAVVVTSAIVIVLTLYTFWAAREGLDFSFLFPFLFACLPVLVIYLVIQIFFPLPSIFYTIYSCVASTVFSGFIIFDTEQMIKRHAYNEYIIAAISLYMDIINLFMSVVLGFSTPN
ncbi:protein LIFEGUARD 1-like [Curcuma longa]|uniref:protein LIFEGUARD 1-like n=1 Tax=Curcuma longa TaxID=136217 RepID=UPI003D9DB1CB